MKSNTRGALTVVGFWCFIGLTIWQPRAAVIVLSVLVSWFIYAVVADV